MLRLGLVGRGRWGTNIERTLLTFPDIAVVPIGRDLAPPAGLDGVVIATPAATHAEIALPYVDKGLPTFIEKPMTTSLADAQRLCDAAHRSSAAIFVGHIYLYNPAFQRMLEVVRPLGAIRHVLCEGMGAIVRAGSSIIWEWLPHHLSMARELFGTDPVAVEAWRLSPSPDLHSAVARYFYGPTPVVSVMSAFSSVKRRCVTVSCEKGSVAFDDTAARKLTVYDGDGVASHPAYDDELPLNREIRSFLEVVRTGRLDRSHAAEGMAIVRQVAAAQSSVSNGGSRVAL